MGIIIIIDPKNFMLAETIEHHYRAILSPLPHIQRSRRGRRQLRVGDERELGSEDYRATY